MYAFVSVATISHFGEMNVDDSVSNYATHTNIQPPRIIKCIKWLEFKKKFSINCQLIAKEKKLHAMKWMEKK